MSDFIQPLPYPPAPQRDTAGSTSRALPDGYIRRDIPWVDPDDRLAELIERFRGAWDHLPERGTEGVEK